MRGDLVLVNGHVITMDRTRPEASAVAIRNGTIAAVGDDAAARAAAGPGAEVIDLRGRTATPGLIDAHAHPMAVGFALQDLDLATPPNRSIADIAALVATAARQRPPGEWIVGRGYDQARLAEQRHPTRHDLDPMAPNNPTLLIRICHHVGVANSRALQLAGITATTPDPDGGRIDRDEHGEPTGVVELPVEWIRDDAVYFNMDRFSGLRPYTAPEVVLSIFRREFETAYDEGGLFLLTMHPHHIGHRSRIWILDEIIRIAKAKPDVWIATHAEIAQYCADQAGLRRI